ncbi:hypothetical protein DL98DRAFT_594681 [Cadophora sp. DSE1049]|nr:hypothetical protein DL98DRAFT_594681 [Cadophora sp. DSE1049]
MRISTLSFVFATSSVVVAQDFIVNGNASNLLSCRGSQLRNDYCCFDGTFSGPAWTSADSSTSITLVRKSVLTIRHLKKRDVVTEMAPGLTCSGFAAITLTNSDASALLASATSAADAGDGVGESTVSGEGASSMSESSGGQASETQTPTPTATTSAAVESASVASTSTNGAAMATKVPLLVVGGMVGVIGYVL